jgi:GNAT superfamily N-acetyltransferase
LFREVADEVLVAQWGDEIVGFAALKLNSPEEGEGLLSGVEPAYQNNGIHKALLLGRANWCRNRGAKRFLQSTQGTNFKVLKNWQALGFFPSHNYYTFHKWFDR